MTVDQDLVLTSSGLNIVKSILPRTLQLMTLSRGSHAFDLFLQLTRVCQVYLYSVLCIFNTCHPCDYDKKGIEHQRLLDTEFEALFGDLDFKARLNDHRAEFGLSERQAADQEGDMSVDKIDLF